MAGLDELAVRLGEVRDRLREAGDGKLSRQLADGIGKAVDPLKDELHAGLRPRLPNRYADVLDAELDVFRRTHTTPDGAQVTVYARTAGPSKRKLRRLDQGILWHPVFGDRKEWREQGAPSVEPGWFSGPVEDAVPEVRKAIEQALNDVLGEVTR
jgi:hypothetical protein